MTTNTDDLREIFVNVSGVETVTERQQEEPCRDPIEDHDAEREAEVSAFVGEDGLGDALEGLDAGGDYDAVTG